MSLIKSISGIRGTIGGKPGDGLTPIDAVLFTSAFTEWAKKNSGKENPKIVVGRDARISGEMIAGLVCNTLVGMGAHVIDVGLSTTPTVEFAVVNEQANAGIILTASHNPAQWNALKLLNHKGEFISAETGAEVLRIAAANDFNYAGIEALGTVTSIPNYIGIHISSILKLPLVNKDLISKAGFKIVVDGINSTGGTAVPELLRALGVGNITVLNGEPNGKFAHNPEPLPEHLTETSKEIVAKKADMGIVVDPDVDRLAFINEDGTMFGEEYTLVAIADYVLSHKKGNTVSNLSSTRALHDITLKHGGSYAAAAVGEVNVVMKMKETQAVIGGEGNGGIIYPDAHYGRDALVGIALFLSHLAEKKMSLTELKNQYPAYHMSKNKIDLNTGVNVDDLLSKIKDLHKKEKINTVDGVKIDFAEGWVHLRKSNTEPIIRIYSEGKSPEKANEYAELIKQNVKAILG
ncbi:MAG TPA: phosphoglucosamine mutase [Flavobacteriales bacterium]|nr:phosphoglucosamine mutase [Flavobacteriales bacterium]